VTQRGSRNRDARRLRFLRHWYPSIVEMNWDSAKAALYATDFGLDALSNYTVFAAVSNESKQKHGGPGGARGLLASSRLIQIGNHDPKTSERILEVRCAT
jgi:hypothetical protein